MNFECNFIVVSFPGMHSYANVSLQFLRAGNINIFLSFIPTQMYSRKWKIPKNIEWMNEWIFTSTESGEEFSSANCKGTSVIV